MSRKKTPFISFFPSDWKSKASNLNVFEELILLKVSLENWSTGKAIRERDLPRCFRVNVPAKKIKTAVEELIRLEILSRDRAGALYDEDAVEAWRKAQKRIRNSAMANDIKKLKKQGKSQREIEEILANMEDPGGTPAGPPGGAPGGTPGGERPETEGSTYPQPQPQPQPHSHQDKGGGLQPQPPLSVEEHKRKLREALG